MKQQLNETQSICCDDESLVGGVLLLVAPQALLSFLFLGAAQVPLKFLSQVPLTCSGRLLEPRGARPAVEGATTPGRRPCLLLAPPALPSLQVAAPQISGNNLVQAKNRFSETEK